MRGTNRSAPLHVELHAAGYGACPRDAFDAPAERRGQRLGVSIRLHGHDGVRPHAAFELARGVQGEDLAVIHDRHPVTELVGFFHVVGRQHDGLPLGVEVTQEIPQGQTALWVKSCCRLVEEEDGRSVKDGPRHHEPLRHAARQARRPRPWRSA